MRMSKNNLQIIVNADDFGLSESTNFAILKAFNYGIISTTTLMCNMPGFNEACEIIFENKLNDKIGVHLNLSEGQPLTEPIKKIEIFYRNGAMYKSIKRHFLNKEERTAIFKELKAQLDRCIKMGINPTHLDSHHHIHHYWDIGGIVQELAIKSKIKAVRLQFNWGNLSKKRLIYSKLYNFRLRISNLAKSKYFCEINSVSSELLRKNSPIEVMVHPCLNYQNTITNYYNGENLVELVKNQIPLENLTTYKHLIFYN